MLKGSLNGHTKKHESITRRLISRGQCVKSDELCDGAYDCVDRSDESNCDSTPTKVELGRTHSSNLKHALKNTWGFCSLCYFFFQDVIHVSGARADDPGKGRNLCRLICRSDFAIDRSHNAC